MNIMDIKEGKTFYHLRITSSGQIYELNKVTVDAIRGNIQVIFQIRYSVHNSAISYTTLYECLYITISNSPYFIKMGAEEYLTLPNKQALMKAVRAQVTRYSTYPQSKPRTVINYRDSMKRIKQLH
jgi:hypothetical protein